MKDKEFEKWVDKRALYSTVERVLKNHADEIIISEYALQCLIEDAREEGEKKGLREVHEKYYFGYARGICYDCKAHDDYFMNTETRMRNNGFGTLEACKSCKKKRLLNRPFSELTDEDFSEEVAKVKKGA